MHNKKIIIHLKSRSSNKIGGQETIIKEVKIAKDTEGYHVLENNTSTPYLTLNEALLSPSINQKWTNLSIDTTLKLSDIKHLILTQWGDWGHDSPQLIRVNNLYYHKLESPKNNPPKEFSGSLADNNLKDPITQKLKSLFICEKNTKEYVGLKNHLLKLLAEKNYKSYNGDSRDFGGLNCTGMSILYKVPYDKRGNLSPYRGKTVRICCMGAKEHAVRKFLVGHIDPAEALEKKPPSSATFPGFLAPVKIDPEVPIELQLHIKNRNYEGAKALLKESKLTHEIINRIQHSEVGILNQLAEDGEIKLLKLLQIHGVELGCPKSPPPPSQPLPKERYWHSLLWTIHENHPSKTKEMITLYNQKEFKDLAENQETPLASEIKSIILSERDRRLKKAVEDYSKATLTLD
jgi:hypothetical protein